jgi:FtsZ-binding cell division protein ZapB
MANENKNINELVSPVDDDPTSEFQIPGPRRNAVLNGQQENETDERTFDVDRVAIEDDPEFDSIAAINHKLLQQAATIEQLQFELEKLRTKANGLECEVRAREEIAKNIRSEFVAVKKQLAHSRKALQERQLEIDFLQHSLTESGATTSQATVAAREAKAPAEMVLTRWP